MPPRASHRLTVLLALPPGRGRDALAAVRALPQVLVGGHGAVDVEVHEAERFLANAQGGFRVSCPDRGAPVGRAFSRALQAWREGGARRVECPCGVRHDLAELHFEPPAAFAREWLRIADAQDGELTPEARRVLADAAGEVRVVWRRG